MSDLKFTFIAIFIALGVYGLGVGVGYTRGFNHALEYRSSVVNKTLDAVEQCRSCQGRIK